MEGLPLHQLHKQNRRQGTLQPFRQISVKRNAQVTTALPASKSDGPSLFAWAHFPPDWWFVGNELLLLAVHFTDRYFCRSTIVCLEVTLSDAGKAVEKNNLV